MNASISQCIYMTIITLLDNINYIQLTTNKCY